MADKTQTQLNTAATAARNEREWMIKRNDRIRAAHAAGWSFRDIGEAVGMTHGAVRKITMRDN